MPRVCRPCLIASLGQALCLQPAPAACACLRWTAGKAPTLSLAPTMPCTPHRAPAQEYVAVACKHGITPVQLALAWCNSRWCVSAAGKGGRMVCPTRCRLVLCCPCAFCTCSRPPLPPSPQVGRLHEHDAHAQTPVPHPTAAHTLPPHTPLPCQVCRQLHHRRHQHHTAPRKHRGVRRAAQRGGAGGRECGVPAFPRPGLQLKGAPSRRHVVLQHPATPTSRKWGSAGGGTQHNSPVLPPLPPLLHA